jgi:hypothetical protein
MADRFGRVLRGQVNTLVFDETLRVAFKIERDSKASTPNKAEVQIYNLSDDSKKRLQRKGAPVLLEAGYVDTIGQIFVGKIVAVSHVTTTAGDIITKVIATDGGQELATARVNESLAPGTTIQQVAAVIIQALGLKAGNALTELGKGDLRKGLIDFANGKTLHGYAATELKKLLHSAGLEFSVQDGALQVTRPGEAVTEAVLLDSSSGLIGSPEYGETGGEKDKHIVLKAKSLLEPRLVPGRPVVISSETTGNLGTFRIEKVTHTGDNMGQAWYSDIECRQLRGALVST